LAAGLVMHSPTYGSARFGNPFGRRLRGVSPCMSSGALANLPIASGQRPALVRELGGALGGRVTRRIGVRDHRKGRWVGRIGAHRNGFREIKERQNDDCALLQSITYVSRSVSNGNADATDLNLSNQQPNPPSHVLTIALSVRNQLLIGCPS